MSYQINTLFIPIEKRWFVLALLLITQSNSERRRYGYQNKDVRILWCERKRSWIKWYDIIDMIPRMLGVRESSNSQPILNKIYKNLSRQLLNTPCIAVFSYEEIKVNHFCPWERRKPISHRVILCGEPSCDISHSIKLIKYYKNMQLQSDSGHPSGP